MINRLRNKLFVRPKNLILIFIAVSFLIIVSAVIELVLSRQELLNLMEEQGHSLLETIIVNSTNTLLADEEVELKIKERLLNNANFLKLLYEKNQVTNELLKRIAEENQLFRIHIFDNSGKLKFSSHFPRNRQAETDQVADNLILPILEGLIDTLIITNKKGRFSEGRRFVYALATGDRSVILMNLDAEELLAFKNEIGFGKMLTRLEAMPGVEYIALQDTSSILAGAGKIDLLSNIQDSEFLMSNYTDSTFSWRLSDETDLEVFEAVHPFYYGENLIGIFRLGISLSPLEAVNDTIVSRVIIISIVLILVGFIVFTLLFTNENYKTLKKQYSLIETYSNKIIDNVSDGIIVVNKDMQITVFNYAAAKILNYAKDEIIGSDINKIKGLNIPIDENRIRPVNITLNGRTKYLLVSTNHFENEKDSKNSIIVLRDITDIHEKEMQSALHDKLIAMGELASGVAHEIRNPLNSISTISQQLCKDFEPSENKEEYRALSKIIINEVKRIDETVKSFLQFARPEPLNPEVFQLKELIDEIDKQYLSYLSLKNILLVKKINWSGSVEWDKNKIKQVIINLLENAADAIKEQGEIVLEVGLSIKGLVEITVKDNGAGIPIDIQKNIFNIYFTTKAKGSGLGLSISQRIVSEHNGRINVESVVGEGSRFLIILPTDKNYLV